MHIFVVAERFSCKKSPFPFHVGKHVFPVCGGAPTRAVATRLGGR